MVLASAHFLCTDCDQEALLLQTDCTTRYIKQNLVNCCTIVGTRCTTNPYVDSRFRPGPVLPPGESVSVYAAMCYQCYPLASQFELPPIAASPTPQGPMANMTPSTEPEVYNLSQRRQTRTKPPQPWHTTGRSLALCGRLNTCSTFRCTSISVHYTVKLCSNLRLAVLVELRLVTDRWTQTDTGPWLVPRMHNIAR